MIDLILLGLIAYVLVSKITFSTAVFVALASGLLIGLIFGRFLSIFQLIPSLIICVGVPIVFSLDNGLSFLPNAVTLGFLLFAGYGIGIAIKILLIPLNFLANLINMLKRS